MSGRASDVKSVCNQTSGILLQTLFLFPIILDRLADGIKHESPWTMMFTYHSVSCSETRQQVEPRKEEVWYWREGE